MSYPGQVYEDPEYYDNESDWDDIEEDEDASYDPFDTVNS